MAARGRALDGSHPIAARHPAGPRRHHTSGDHLSWLKPSSSAPFACRPASSWARSRTSLRPRSARWSCARPSRAPASTRRASTSASWATSSSGGEGQAPARQAALKGGLSDHVGGAHHQQGVRLGPQGGDAGAPGHPHGRHRDCRGRRHGVDEQLPVPHPARARGPAHGPRTGRRHDDSRRAVVPVRELAHGQRRRDGCRGLQGVPRGAGCLLGRQPRKAAAAQASGAFKDEILPVSIPQKKGDAARLRQGRVGARRHHRRDAARAQAGVQEGRHGDGRQRAAGERRRRGAGRDERRARARRSASSRWRASSRRPRAAWRRRCC